MILIENHTENRAKTKTIICCCGLKTYAAERGKIDTCQLQVSKSSI